MRTTLLAAGLVLALCGTGATQVAADPDESRMQLAGMCMPVDDGAGRARALDPDTAALCIGWMAWEVQGLRGDLDLMQQHMCFIETILCAKLDGLCDEGARSFSSACRDRPH